MTDKQVTFEALDSLHAGKAFPAYCSSLARHVADGDSRLGKLLFDPSAASFQLWNFLLTEEERLRQAQDRGTLIVGTMKDLGTVPVMVYSLPDALAFYPDGAWWIPCLMELKAGMLTEADKLGIDESFCPVRAMLGAFVTGNHFPRPDLLISSTGAVCDDFSAIAQRLEGLGFDIVWWEMPHIREPEAGENAVRLPGGRMAAAAQQGYLLQEWERIRKLLSEKSGCELTDERLKAGIAKCNHVRSLLTTLRQRVFTAETSPLPALEMLIAEMLAIHFCSDLDETINILQGLLNLVNRRIQQAGGTPPGRAVKVFWVNPVADLRAMNILEACGCRLCGTDFMFPQSLDTIPEDIPPLEALARIAMDDPMAASSKRRAERIIRDIRSFGSEAVVISKIPGASHCAFEGGIIGDMLRDRLGIPVAEIEVPPLADGVMMKLKTKIQTIRDMVVYDSGL